MRGRVATGIIISTLTCLLIVYLLLGETSTEEGSVQAFNLVNILGIFGVVLGIIIAVSMFRKKE